MNKINQQLENIKKSLDDMHFNVAVSDEAMENLHELYSIIWTHTCYHCDPSSEGSRRLANELLPYIKALNTELKFSK